MQHAAGVHVHAWDRGLRRQMGGEKRETDSHPPNDIDPFKAPNQIMPFRQFVGLHL